MLDIGRGQVNTELRRPIDAVERRCRGGPLRKGPPGVSDGNVLMQHQEGKQFEFLGREMDDFPGLAQTAAFQVQFQFARAENRGRRGPLATGSAQS
jgi:hypothetical protein